MTPNDASDGGTDHARPRLFIVEDEMCLAMVLDDLLTDHGFDVVLSGRLADALRKADQDFDGAVLDINLGGDAVYPVAAALRERNIPFLFASAYGHPAIPADFHDAPVLQKPYAMNDLIAALDAMVRIRH